MSRTRGMSFSISCCWRVRVPVETIVFRPERIAGTRYASVLPIPVAASATSTRGVSSASAHASAIRSCPGRDSNPGIARAIGPSGGERHPHFSGEISGHARLRSRDGDEVPQLDLQEGDFPAQIPRGSELERSRHAGVIFQAGDPLAHRLPEGASRNRPRAKTPRRETGRRRTPSPRTGWGEHASPPGTPSGTGRPGTPGSRRSSPPGRPPRRRNRPPSAAVRRRSTRRTRPAADRRCSSAAATQGGRPGPTGPR